MESKKIISIIAILLGLLLVAGSIGIYLNSKPTNKEEKKEENKPEDNRPEIEPDETAIDDMVNKLFEKYNNNSITNVILVQKDKYVLKDAKELELSFSLKIYDNIRDELKQYETNDGDQYEVYVPADKTRDIIKKAFDDYFGHVIEFSDELLSGDLNVKRDLKGCNFFYYEKDKDRYRLFSNCGVPQFSGYIEYQITKATKDDKNIYLYETINVRETDDKSPIKETANAKWTFIKQPDGNYYFYSVETIE